MKKLGVVLFLAALLAGPAPVTGRVAVAGQASRSAQTGDVGEVLLLVSRVVQRAGGKPVGTASGFFYQVQDRLFFVTNRHVVVGEPKGTPPDELVLFLHVDPKDIAQSAEQVVPLSRGGKPTYLLHPKYPKPPIDIAVVPLPDEVGKRFVIKALSSRNVLPQELLLLPGDDAMVIGYPLGLSDTVNNLPIIRNALVASAPGVFFQGQPFFLIDANLHPGMSGSPVMTRPRNAWPTKAGGVSFMTGTPMYFLGVHSATLSANVGTAPQPLGLASVWYAFLIDEIIAGK